MTDAITQAIEPFVSAVENLIDRLACRLGIWALRHLFGECEQDIREDFPDDPDAECIGCDSARIIRAMQQVLENA